MQSKHGSKSAPRDVTGKNMRSTTESIGVYSQMRSPHFERISTIPCPKEQKSGITAIPIGWRNQVEMPP